ncbi:MAG TPA: hypothetical protein VEQ15_09290 [Myxococcales bacterium]|nr:hypothetical protein [Myxococcales bacterium]
MSRGAAALMLVVGGGVAGPELVRVGLSDLRVTEGKVLPGPGGALRIEDSKVRAVVRHPTGSTAELRFVYLGPSVEQKPLSSGEMRSQIGLKLRAEDGCNLLYAMWRIAPRPGLVVSLKRNPGMHSSGDCGNGGYTNLKPRRGSRVPAFEQGARHALRAEQRGDELRVLVDGTSAWEGTLPPEALSLRGPAGVRSDNGRFDLELFVSLP